MRYPAVLSFGLVMLPLHSPEAQAESSCSEVPSHYGSQNTANRTFRRIATLPNYLNNQDASASTVSEITAATLDGQLLVYTDSPMNEIGFVDITDPSAPMALGKLAMPGEPASAATLGNDLGLIAVNTSESFVAPSGQLVVVDLLTRSIVTQIPLDGQPDSVRMSPDGKYAAVVIENQRDESLEVDGEEGGLPQLPAGSLAIVDLCGTPAQWTVRYADLTGLAAYGASDPEPEFVDIDTRNRAVVSLQENNHIAIVDLPSGSVVEDFPAGTQTLVGIDATEDGVISLTETLDSVPREPDAIAWVSVGKKRYIATANEGDLFGGSRGFTLFTPQGHVVFDSGALLERIAVRHGHYPEARSENKGAEPEAVAFARFGATDYVFVGSERGSFVAVFTVDALGQAQFVQLLPAPFGPEGLLLLPSRGLVVASSENDDPPYGVRSTIMIYELGKGRPDYPQIVSNDDDLGNPIAWSAVSGLAANPNSSDELLAVTDSYYSEAAILKVNTAVTPATIADSTFVSGSGDLDIEGIAVAADGTFWLASEGNEVDTPANRLLQTDADGNVLLEVNLPAEVDACRAESSAIESLGGGFQGIAVWRNTGLLLVAQQRGWNYTTPECEALDDDPNDVADDEPSFTRLWTFEPNTGAWDHIVYELESKPSVASWVGLSEVSAVRDGFVVVERDDRSGDFADLKTLVKVSFAALADGVVTRDEKQAFDLLPALHATNGWVTAKPEGVAVNKRGELFVVSDNNGVEDWSGETWFLRLGNVKQLF